MNAEHRQQLKAAMHAVFPSNEEMWALGLAISLWGNIDNEFRRTVHALAGCERETWDEFNRLTSIRDRARWAREKARGKFLMAFAMEFIEICDEVKDVRETLGKALDHAWEQETSLISLCGPKPLPRWMPEFCEPHWDCEAEEWYALALRADLLRLRLIAFNTRFLEEGGSARAAIERMFKANNPEAAAKHYWSKPSTQASIEKTKDWDL